MNYQAFPSRTRSSDDSGLGGLALLAISSATEICEAVPELQARGFFAAIGRRMAALESLDGLSDAALLSIRINDFWRALDWGEARLELTDEGIVVQHTNLPRDIAPDPRGHWATMLAGVLEGAYDSWFRTLGSGPALTTTAEWKGDTLELRHGR
ncbi:cellulose biosynthesis protein BcsD [Novosphingobium sp. BW1]|uniref:cellulose biosynthesis protein BcsD n=1 Tax=Novosphingobium sp. BW1 TaxID=2592621 RepID=UPI0011DE987E|nr:cellulose biosynthesis protein BcsD [Novosphingobium sp. BW1]TYC80995.1 hypothetical protein FMM79_19760 [Novosphingobium sp. BW1]